MILIKVLKNTVLIIKGKILVVLDMITDMLSNEKLNPVVTKLFMRGRKLNIYLNKLSFYHNLILF